MACWKCHCPYRPTDLPAGPKYWLHREDTRWNTELHRAGPLRRKRKCSTLETLGTVSKEGTESPESKSAHSLLLPANCKHFVSSSLKSNTQYGIFIHCKEIIYQHFCTIAVFTMCPGLYSNWWGLKIPEASRFPESSLTTTFSITLTQNRRSGRGQLIVGFLN